MVPEVAGLLVAIKASQPTSGEAPCYHYLFLLLGFYAACDREAAFRSCFVRRTEATGTRWAGGTGKRTGIARPVARTRPIAVQHLLVCTKRRIVLAPQNMSAEHCEREP